MFQQLITVNAELLAKIDSAIASHHRRRHHLANQCPPMHPVPRLCLPKGEGSSSLSSGARMQFPRQLGRELRTQLNLPSSRLPPDRATVSADWPDHSHPHPYPHPPRLWQHQQTGQNQQRQQQHQLRRRWRRHMLWVHSIKITSWLCYMHPGPVPSSPFQSAPFHPFTPLRILLIFTLKKKREG